MVGRRGTKHVQCQRGVGRMACGGWRMVDDAGGRSLGCDRLGTLSS